MVNHLGDFCEQVRYNNGIKGSVLYQYADVNKPFFVKITVYMQNLCALEYSAGRIKEARYRENCKTTSYYL